MFEMYPFILIHEAITTRDDTLKYTFVYLSEKERLDISCKSSA